MHTGHNGHEVSIRFFHGGIAGITGRPTMGSWLVYGLGSESQELPAYMVLSDPGGPPVDGTINWSSGFMPPLYQGTVLRPEEPRILNLDPPPHLRGEPAASRTSRSSTGSTAAPGTASGRVRPGSADPELRAGRGHADGRQGGARHLERARVTSAGSTAWTRTPTREYGTRCLIARRLVERGVRFVQLFLGGQPWDTHNSIRTSLPAICRRTDQPAAALVTDLKQRGLLDTTIVHWGGEIGRLPVSEGNLDASAGRDHNGQGFSIWLAGGGIKGGMTYGATDEVGHRAVENVVTPNDFQATILHLFGLDHNRLVYHANGREQRLIDGRPARVVKEILRTA